MNFIATRNGYLRKSCIYFIQKEDSQTTHVYTTTDSESFKIDKPIETVLELLEDGE
jgi:hypothetical protein